jgi:hypothetical protein
VQNHEHRIVAPSSGIGRPDRIEQLLDLFGLQITRQGVPRWLRDARDGCRKIALGLPAPEQKAEQIAQM